LNKRLDEPQSQSGHGGEQKKFVSCQELNPGHPACSLVTILSYCSLHYFLKNLNYAGIQMTVQFHSLMKVLFIQLKNRHMKMK